MFTEIVRIRILPGTEDAFEAAVAKAVDVFRRAEGCHGLGLSHCIEEPGLYAVAIRWRRVEDHTIGFRESTLFQEWRAFVSPYFAEPPNATHWTTRIEAVDF